MLLSFDAPASRQSPTLTLSLRKLAAGLALVAGLAAAGCSRQTPSGALSGKDVDYALEVLTKAPEHGFSPDAFEVERIKALGHDGKTAERDKLLRAELVAYARAQHGLSIPKSAWPAAWGMRPPAYDAQAELTKAVQGGKFRDWLDSQAPDDERYKGLQAGYQTYLRLAANGGWQPLTPRGALKLGAAGPDVAALRQRLRAEDGAVPEADANAVFDQALADGVARFQAAHGLPTTGVVDKATLAELNVPARARAAQIRASLERLRWMPRDEPATRVDVNTAAAEMTYVVDGRPQIHMLAASGRPGDETPMLHSAIDSIVLNPPWNVPDGIAKEELYPKEAANPGYFAAHNYAVENGRVVQKPGPDSALGLVKFDFDNPYAVYLHDTPSKAAFSKTQRAVSHGCVRLAQAVPFSKVLLSNESGWSAERVDQVLAGGETTTVKLSRKVPVRLMYLTAYPENGRIAFRPDVYGWDAQLLDLLDRGGKTVAALDGGGRRS